MPQPKPEQNEWLTKWSLEKRPRIENPILLLRKIGKFVKFAAKHLTVGGALVLSVVPLCAVPYTLYEARKYNEHGNVTLASARADNVRYLFQGLPQIPIQFITDWHYSAILEKVEALIGLALYDDAVVLLTQAEEYFGERRKARCSLLRAKIFSYTRAQCSFGVSASEFVIGVLTKDAAKSLLGMQGRERVEYLKKTLSEEEQKLLVDALLVLGNCHRRQGAYTDSANCFALAQDLVSEGIHVTPRTRCEILYSVGSLARNLLDPYIILLENSAGLRLLKYLKSLARTLIAFCKGSPYISEEQRNRAALDVINSWVLYFYKRAEEEAHQFNCPLHEVYSRSRFLLHCDCSKEKVTNHEVDFTQVLHKFPKSKDGKYHQGVKDIFYTLCVIKKDVPWFILMHNSLRILDSHKALECAMILLLRTQERKTPLPGNVQIEWCRPFITEYLAHIATNRSTVTRKELRYASNELVRDVATRLRIELPKLSPSSFLVETPSDHETAFDTLKQWIKQKGWDMRIKL